MALEQHVCCDVRASFAAAFGAWRRSRKIPLKQIASDLGVSVSTVNSWEGGQRFPSGYNFELLVAYTGLPPCRLFCVFAERCVPVECLLRNEQLSRSLRVAGLPVERETRRFTL